MCAGNWFPFNYRDVKGWHDLGLPITAPSNESAKQLDAALTALIFNDTDPVLGNFETIMSRLKSAYPDFVMGNVVWMSHSILGMSLRKYSKLVEEINSFVERCKLMTMSNWEKQHVQALGFLSKGKWFSSTEIYEDIMIQHPKDVQALQMLFRIYFFTGKCDRLRDIHLSVAKHSSKDDRFYGNLHGKICFGYEECGQYEAAEKAGRIGLDHTPNDIWTMHSMVHVREETWRPVEGLRFIEETEKNWLPRSSLVQHMWWHKSLFYISTENYESAVTIFDQHLLRVAKKETNAFHLSNATSLLMRLELEGLPARTSLKDRWRELALLYEDQVDNSDGLLFYDFHTLVATLYGDKPKCSEEVIDLVASSTQTEDESDLGVNLKLNLKFGSELLHGLKAYHDSDYDSAVKYLKPIRYDLADLAGSHAQKDILNQVLLWSSIKSGNRRLSEHLLEERVAPKDLLVPDYHNLLHNRMESKINLI